jgi:hypothetical protein
LLEERLEASRAADKAREAHLRLAEAVRQYVVQGVPIPFALEAASNAGPGTPFKIVPLSHAHPAPQLNATDVAVAAARDAAATAAGGNSRKQRPGSAADKPKQPKASRNALRKMLDKLGLEGDNMAHLPVASAYAESQKRFLDQVRLNPGNPSVYAAAAPGAGPFPGFSPKAAYPKGAFINPEGLNKGPSILSSELTSILQIVSSSDGSMRRSGSKGRRTEGLIVASNQTSGSLAAIRSLKSQDDEAISTLKEVQVRGGSIGGRAGSKSGSLAGARKELVYLAVESEGMSAPNAVPASDWVGALDGELDEPEEQSGSF